MITIKISLSFKFVTVNERDMQQYRQARPTHIQFIGHLTGVCISSSDYAAMTRLILLSRRDREF